MLAFAVSLIFAASVPTGLLAAQSDASALLKFLDGVVDWYRGANIEQSVTTGPNDILILSENHQVADQVIQQAFAFAKAEATSIAQSASTNQEQEQNGTPSQSSSLIQLSQQIDREVQQLQSTLESEKQSLQSATGRKRQQLAESVAETQSALDLAQAREEAVDNMAEFAEEAGAVGQGPANLRAQIQALERGIPALSSNMPNNKGANAASGATANANAASNQANRAAEQKPVPTGLWGLVSQLFALSGDVRTLQQRIDATDVLNRSADQFRTPLVNTLKALSAQGDSLSGQTGATTPADLAQRKSQLDSLTAQFKETSERVLPLSKMRILLNLYRSNLVEWQVGVKSEEASVLKSLLVRLIFFGVILGIIFGLAEIWRRAIVRYVHDFRRRYQLLLIRRIVVSFTVIIVIAFAFASELTAVATFAGLLTAGVAVALQNVILSIAGYFFLIGKYGIRVGDRVEIAGVSGEVVDVGLVRLYMLETGSAGPSSPSGRVVAFPNSVVFQSSTGLFKQIPGTNFDWHELTLTVPAGSDWSAIEAKVRETVEKVFSGYREEMERQHQQMETILTSTSVSPLTPTTRVQYSPTGLEVVARYPVDLLHAADIDDQMTRELVQAIHREAKAEGAGSPTPNVKLTKNVTPAGTPSS